MKPGNVLVACAAAAAVAGGLVWRSSASAALEFPVRGVVVAVNADGTIAVAHDEIPDFMPAMTMPFTPSDAAAGARLTPGDRIEFTLRVDADRSRAERVRVTGRAQTIDRSSPARPGGRVREGEPMPPFTLVDQDGAPLNNDSLRGGRTVLTFVFTRCPLPEFCPRIVSRLKELQKAIKADALLADVDLLAVTLDPAFDTPEVLAAYGRAAGADFERWRFATGTTEEIAGLTRALAVHVERSGVLPDHTLATTLIDAQGRIGEVWRGNFWETQEVLDALR